MTKAEIIARAWNPVGWSWYDRIPNTHPEKETFYNDQIKCGEAVLETLRDYGWMPEND